MNFVNYKNSQVKNKKTQNIFPELAKIKNKNKIKRRFIRFKIKKAKQKKKIYFSVCFAKREKNE